VARIGGAVGDAPAEPVGAFDDRDPHRRAGAQQMDGGERPRRTTADDGDVDRLRACHARDQTTAGAVCAMSRA
jgi:hypothetical protein